MNTIANDTTLHHELVKNFKASANLSKDKVGQKREEAFQLFEKSGFPTNKNEEWKYTNVKNITEKNFSLNNQTSIYKKDIEHLMIEGLDANVIVFINGIFNKELSNISSPADTLIIKNLPDADKDILEQYFSGNLAFANDSFTTLNTAFAENGAFIFVPKGKKVDKPVLLHFISDTRNGDVMSQPRNLFVLEENAEVSIVESFNTLGDHNSFTNTLTEIVLKKEARLDYYKIQNESDKAYHVGTTQIYHEEKSYATSHTVTLSGAIVRNNLNIALNAEYCEAHLNGLYLLQGNQHVDNHTLVDHAKANCYSNELYKGIMNDKSTGVFNGKIYVRQDAQKTNAFQSNKNILLSKDASVNTKPQLEIYADDVKCSHGATTGQLDDESIFYMQARGISKENAKALLTYAFASDIIERIKIEPLRVNLNKKIAERLNKEIINELF